jgi:hypothetical protein
VPHLLVDTGAYGVQELPLFVCHNVDVIRRDEKAELPRRRGRVAGRGRGQGRSDTATGLPPKDAA